MDDPQAELSRPQLDVGRFRIGCDRDCEIVIDVNGVSRRHAELEVPDSGGLIVRDLGSTNGTRIDGRPVGTAALHGDFTLELGPVRLRLREHVTGLDRLAFATGQDGAAQPTAPAAAEAPGTRLLTVFDRLRDVALAHWPGHADPDWRAGLSHLFAEWLPVLGCSGLRLCRREDDSVLAQATDGREPEWCEWLLDDDYRIDADATVVAAAGRLHPRLEPLLAWLPRPAPVSPADDATAIAAPGQASHNPAMRRVLQGLARAARGRVGVLLLGETGSGKELLARWVHDHSPRSAGAFVAVNCAALPRDLLEAELFGIEKGAATGVEARPGLFERAHGGTLFLDELGDMAPDTQVRLLRALEDGRVHRIGGHRLIETDVRIVAATHQDLQAAIAERRFRLDLYHRLAGVVVSVPPLRERPEDIAPLAIHFFTRALAENGIGSPGIAADALLALQRWHWPGNIRELRQCIEGTVVMLAQGEVLSRTHLPAAIRGEAPDHQALNLARLVGEAEREALVTAMAAAGGDHRLAWSLLGVGKTTFYKLLREHGLSRGRGDDDEAGH